MSEQAAWRVVARGIALVFGIVLALSLAAALGPILIVFLVAILLAAAATPLVDRLTQRSCTGRWRWRPGRGVAAVGVFLVVLLVLVALFFFVVSAVATEVSELVAAMPEYVARLRIAADDLVARNPALVGAIQSALPSVQTVLSALPGVLAPIPGLATGLIGGVVTAFIAVVLALYLTIDGDRIRRYIIQFLPFNRHEQALRVTANVGARLGAWARGEALLMVIIGAMTWLAALLIGLPYAAVLAVIAAIGELIPNIGPAIAAVPLIAVGLLSSPTQGFLALVAALLIQQLENNLIVPRVMGRAVELHPIVVVGAILAGDQLLGIPGAILAVPVAAALAVVLDEVQRERIASHQRARGDAPEPTVDRPAVP